MRKLWVPLSLLITLFVFSGDTHAQAVAEYVVDANVPCLSEISVRLYGTAKKWPAIAEWNGLQPPYPLSIGQKLILKEPPTLTLEEGDRKLVRMREKQRERLGTADPTPLSPISEEEFLAKARAEEQSTNPENPPAADASTRFHQGEDFFRKKKYEEALAEFRGSRELEPKSASAWLYEIRTLRLLKRDDEAAESARKFVENRPDMAGLPALKDLLAGEAPK